MIIDEIIEKSRDYQTDKSAKLDLKYIYDEAVLMRDKDIVWAIAFYWEMDGAIDRVITEAKYNIIHALEDYIKDNQYNEDYIKYLEVLV